MSLTFACVIVAALMNYLSKIPVTIAMHRMPGGYNNKNGRDQQAQLTGWGRRALAAHQNGFESFPIFAAAVILARLQNANPERTAWLAAAFIVFRILYLIFYWVNWDKLRSAVWALGMVCVFLLFVWI